MLVLDRSEQFKAFCEHKIFHTDINESMDESYSSVLTHVSHIVGNPRNYGPTKEELEEEELRRCEEKMRREMEESAKREEMMREEEDKLRRRKMEWVSC